MTQTPEKQKPAEAKNRPPTFFQRHRRRLMVGGPLLLAIAGLIFWLGSGRYMSTDDAYIQAGRVAISTNISGRVSELDVRDNQPVKKSQVLFRLDPRPLKIAIDNAAAKLAAEKLQVQSQKAEYKQRLADLKTAQDTLDYAQKEYARQEKLAASGISSKAQLDQANLSLQSAREKVAAAQEVANAALAKLGGDPDIDVNEHPDVKAAQAALDQANLNMSYATVTAPIDGVVTKVEQLQVGDYVNAAAPLFSLVSTSDIYVEGNFKETDLTYMRPGQAATFKIDAYDAREFRGIVSSISPGTGSSFSLLPPENASGNWVKVVQRVPVRIAIDRDDLNGVPLNPGLSVTVTVDTQHRRSLFGG